MKNYNGQRNYCFPERHTRDILEFKAPSTMIRFKQEIISEIEELDVLVGIKFITRIEGEFQNTKTSMVLDQIKKQLELLLLMLTFLTRKFVKINMGIFTMSQKLLILMGQLNKKQQTQAFAIYLFQLKQMHHLFHYFSNFMIQATRLNPQSIPCSKSRQN
ncbi:Hypothetical_protein [Hexamita inflata]|uniref:Hypothetical_protein n=1 Tax=Hexamita inflata TaxID=28002 RepID=A0AA86QN54_9EUKA|nr:Hypothetical protein HINF_LOCUS48988 [Hexamita inflata]